MDNKTHNERFSQPWLLLVVFGVIALSVLLLRIHFLPTPLERDEGEYAYGAQMLLQGALPYRDFYSLKLPGIFAVYAAILSTFGQSIVGIHLGLLLVSFVNAGLVFLLGKKLFGSIAAIFASSAFLILSAGTSVQGLAANAEAFALLPVLAGLLLMEHAVERRSLALKIIAGLCFGIALLIKQHAAVFAAAATSCLALDYFWGHEQNKPTKRDILVSIISILIPYAIMAMLFAMLGIFDEMLFWTARYAQQYVTSSNSSAFSPVQTFMQTFIPMLRENIFIWMLAAFGVQYSIVFSKPKYVKLLVVTLFSFIAVTPAFYFRPHYFVFVLPSIALWAGIGAAALPDFLKKLFIRVAAMRVWQAVAVGFLLTMGVMVGAQATLTPDELSNYLYRTSLFTQMQAIGDYCRIRTKKDDVIAMVGNEPELYFYAQRKGATGFLYLYPLLERHRLHGNLFSMFSNEMIQHRPALIVFIHNYSEGRSSKYEVQIKDLMTDVLQNYRRSARAQFTADGQMFWNPKMEDHRFDDRRSLTIDIYTRRPG